METPSLMSTIAIRSMQTEDVARCGAVAFAAHRAVSERHNVPSEHPSVEFSTALINAKLADPQATGWVAEAAGQIVGSVFLNTFPPAPVAAIGPLTVDPAAPPGVGRRLMREALARARELGVPSVRLVQSPSHLQSLGLYAKLGFIVREPLVVMQGKCPALQAAPAGPVRRALESDIDACNRVCKSLHGFARELELRNAIRQESARVVERQERVTGYTAGVGLRGHAAAGSTAELMTLLAAMPQMPGPGFFVPVRNGELLRWLLEGGMRMLWPAALMTSGKYQEPAGAFLPSIAY